MFKSGFLSISDHLFDKYVWEWIMPPDPVGQQPLQLVETTRGRSRSAAVVVVEENADQVDQLHQQSSFVARDREGGWELGGL